MTCGDLFLGLIAVLFPPIAVWIKSGICTCDSLINILLCVLGYVPGLLHAWYIIARNPERDYDYEAVPDAEGQRVTYYYIRHEPARRDYGTQQQGHNRPAPPPPKPQSRPAQNGQGSNRPAPPPPAQLEGPSVGAGSGDHGAPPSYSDVIKGDNKIQSQD
ncbi:hypothetical protein LTR10_017283 [Elasticomyces elasticus]|uniref:Stress response RCI peptide n=1 Tax=Exophiala sideris TaxID=1016849 RepID=A0ABR0JJF0_9EURO|nr:hypothetical protein LTR10_017283 [Elasticomyces elasticus]KAK5034156.1 hypothetical protein LTS07_003076 [Exophiala sideris]KAK5042452.1 hypothetical protein LTR13_001299 [Exophiala sideris]KAK5065534.1 hypothetical protein LTR69_003083 [Exophiala sideris]KAK5186007.1 hypothetical protein LTR44_002056 [Eurotiomycetes sp. CCFEE 6388]